MDWKTFIANLVGSLAWPSVALVALLISRRHLTSLIPSLTRLRYKDVEAEFAGEVRSVREKFAAEGEEDFSQLVVTQRVIELAKLSARSAIFDTWLDLEEAIYRAAETHGVETEEKKLPPKLVDDLFKAGVISEGSVNKFRNLRMLRNRAVHNTEEEITVTEAINTSDLMLRFIHEIDNA